MGGMRVGSTHAWRYKTKGKREYANGGFTQYQSKGRNVSSPRGSGMPITSKLKWDINANFKVRKVKGGWLRTTIGIKKQEGFKTPKMKKMRYTRGRNYGRRTNKKHKGY